MQSSSNIANNKDSKDNKDNKDKPKGETKKTNSNQKEDEDSKKIQDSLSSCIVTEKPNVSWDDVAGLEKAKEALKEAVILPFKFPQLFKDKRKPWKGILLYGPPGTGKSFLAKACATEAQSTFYSVSASNIMSKWVGEAEKTVRALFDLARQNKPAVIFIDEIDSLLSARGDNENESSRRVKTEFLVQMQGVGHDDQGILVLGATNIPWDLDPAVRRRFQKKIYINLPELEARYKMLELNIGNTPNNLTDEDLNELAELTEGYSGSDVATLTQEAIYEPLRKCQASKYFKVENGFYYLSSENEFGAKRIDFFEIPEPEKLVSPDVCKEDFVKAISRIRPTVSPKDLEKQEKFTEEFGQEG
jgi:vacuolar protein-sorting-associated protein 4